jgi:hypothetical protein
LLLAYFLLRELRDRFWTLLVFLLIIATTCLATTTIGLLCSALSRRTSVAIVLTYVTLLVLFIGPVGLEWYLQGFSFTPERLAALTITSPYSAACSIPMPLKRGTGFSMEQPNVPPPVLVKLIPALGLGLPVWAWFLMLYPPLCLVLFGVTYLAFRWRWWRAGGSG